MRILRTLLGFIFVCAFAQIAKAQNPNPCSQITNTAINGYVLSATGASSTPPCKWIANGSGGGGITQLTQDVLAGPTTGSVAATVVGLKTVPFCTGFTPTNGQVIQYTTGSTPNPCWSAATGGGGGGSPGGADTNIQVNHPVGTFAGNTDFAWCETNTQCPWGKTGLQLGPPEPLLTCCDGPSNGFSVTGNHAIQENWVAANSSSIGTVQAFYTSAGTLSSPSNITPGAGNTLEQDYFVWFGGAWQQTGIYINDLDSFGGFFYWQIQDTASNPIGDTYFLTPDGTHFMQTLEQPLGTGVGLVPLGSGILEIDNETVGSLAQVKMGTLNQPGIAFASLPTPSNGMQIYCTDCTVTSGIDNTCTASGNGANAKRINGAWKCEQ